MALREIIFRGKRLDNGEWVEGNYWEFCGDHNILVPGNCIGLRVDPSTVGQYTGLKDKNGKKIFEGDIVRCGTGRICKVTFFISPGFIGFDLVPVGGFDAPPPKEWLLFADTEIIGNIHDNPELLEGAEEK